MQHEMVLTIKERVFIVECCAKHNSWKMCAELFAQEFKTGSVLKKPPAKFAMQKLVAKWRETGSVVNKNRNYPKRVRTPENIAKVKESLENSPTTSQRRLSAHVGIKRTSCRNIIKKDLQLHPYKFSIVQELKPPDNKSRVEFCRWFLSEVESGLLDPAYFISTDEARFSLSGYVNSHNMRYYASENPHHYIEQPLHNVKLGVWCAISGLRIITRFFHHTVNANRYVQHLFNPFVDELTEDERLYGYFQQDGGTAHTALTTLSRVHEVFGEERTVSKGSEICWPPRSPDLSPCDFYLWGKLKGVVYANNPQTLEALQQNIENAIAAIPRTELQCVSHSLINRAQRCFHVGGGHFQHLL